MKKSHAIIVIFVLGILFVPAYLYYSFTSEKVLVVNGTTINSSIIEVAPKTTISIPMIGTTAAIVGSSAIVTYSHTIKGTVASITMAVNTVVHSTVSGTMVITYGRIKMIGTFWITSSNNEYSITGTFHRNGEFHGTGTTLNNTKIFTITARILGKTVITTTKI